MKTVPGGSTSTSTLAFACGIFITSIPTTSSTLGMPNRKLKLIDQIWSELVTDKGAQTKSCFSRRPTPTWNRRTGAHVPWVNQLVQGQPNESQFMQGTNLDAMIIYSPEDAHVPLAQMDWLKQVLLLNKTRRCTTSSGVDFLQDEEALNLARKQRSAPIPPRHHLRGQLYS